MRVRGIETEYGIAAQDGAKSNPILLSSQLVAFYRAREGVVTAPWDYGSEDPLQDLRGNRRDRATATDDMLTDAPAFDPAEGRVVRRRRRGSWEDPAHLNAVLVNGARLYVDHAHPEYSGPEVTTARDAVVWDRAGDQIVLRALAEGRARGEAMVAYKNNVDGKGASYGTHENFLVDRAVPFEDLARRITAHLVTRQVYTGAGRVGLGQRGEQPGFQISQRADYMEAEVGLETTLRRPIVNTRDEPHANPDRWRRLHVIIGDANCMDVPTFLKTGTTSLVLSAIEADDARLDALVLADPVEAVYAVSRDLALSRELELASGERGRALDVQRALLEICRDYVRDADDAAVIARWDDVLGRLGRDRDSAASVVEWVAKLGLLGRMRLRGGGKPLPWDDARLAAADIQWSDINPAVGLCRRLEAAGAVERIATDAQIEAAIAEPPPDTRAHVRGRAVATLGDAVDSAGWDTVVIDRDTDHGQLEVARLDDPTQTTHSLIDELIAQAANGDA